MVRLGDVALEEKGVDSLLNGKRVLRSTLGWKVGGGVMLVLLAGFLGVSAASFWLRCKLLLVVSLVMRGGPACLVLFRCLPFKALEAICLALSRLTVLGLLSLFVGRAVLY